MPGKRQRGAAVAVGRVEIGIEHGDVGIEGQHRTVFGVRHGAAERVDPLERDVDRPGRGVAGHEQVVVARRVRRPGHDNPAVGLERQRLGALVAVRADRRLDDPISPAKALIERAGGRETHDPEVVAVGVAGASDEDPAIGLDDDVERELAATTRADIDRDRAVAARGRVEAAACGEANHRKLRGTWRIAPSGDEDPAVGLQGHRIAGVAARRADVDGDLAGAVERRVEHAGVREAHHDDVDVWADDRAAGEQDPAVGIEGNGVGAVIA